MAAGVINYLGGRPRVSPSIHLFSFLLPKDQIKMKMKMNKKVISIPYHIPEETSRTKKNNSFFTTKTLLKKEFSVPLINLAYARSGDKGDHANIGVIARKEEYFDFIDRELNPSTIAQFFSHVIQGDVLKWVLPGINGINFLLKNSLGGGGMASLSIDPQGKAYGQQLLEYSIPVTKKIFDQFHNKN